MLFLNFPNSQQIKLKSIHFGVMKKDSGENGERNTWEKLFLKTECWKECHLQVSYMPAWSKAKMKTSSSFTWKSEKPRRRLGIVD